MIVKDSYASYKIRFIVGKAKNSAIFSRLSQSLWPNKFLDVARYRTWNARFLTILGCYLTTRQFIVLDTYNPCERAHFCLTANINLRGCRRIVKRRRIFSTVNAQISKVHPHFHQSNFRYPVSRFARKFNVTRFLTAIECIKSNSVMRLLSKTCSKKVVKEYRTNVKEKKGLLHELTHLFYASSCENAWKRTCICRGVHASVAKMVQRVDPDRQRREEATPSSNGYEILMTWSHNGINRRVRSFVRTQWRFFGAGIHPINMHRYDHIRGDNVPHACPIHSTTHARMRARDRISNFGEMFSATSGIKTRLIRSDVRSISRLS